MLTSVVRRTRWVFMPILGVLTCAATGVGTPTVLASRFDPPWQSRVAVDQATLYSQADRGAAAVGPLSRGQLVVVVHELTATDGKPWTQVPDGFIPSSDIAEDMSPWIAEVSVPSVPIYARPSAQEPIRRTAKQGDLLRVSGVSPGIEGDTATWWATTEGYVSLHTLREATSDAAQNWTLPDGSQATSGWWGAIRSQANVRAAPTTAAPVVGTQVPGDRVKVLGELNGTAVNGNATWYRIDGGRYAGAVVHSSLVSRMPEPKPVIAARPEDATPGPETLVVSRSAATLTYLDVVNEPQLRTNDRLGRAG